MGKLNPNFIVGIGGSAGSLSAYKAFFDALPSNTGMAFVIVCHILPAASDQLAQILSRHTKMKVIVPLTGMPIRANHVYVNPPNADLLIDSYTFKVVSPRSISNAQVDLFFTSLAQTMGKRAVGIIFSGNDGDGAEGCKKIKSKGGTTFAQDRSAEAEAMPLNAQASGSVDFVLSPDKIPGELQRLISAAPPGRSAFWKEVTKVARILIAATPDAADSMERILGQEHEYVIVEHMADALVQLNEQVFDLIMIGVHFDESRMFELLPQARKILKTVDTPIICFCTQKTPLTSTMHASINVASKALGAWMYLDQHEFSVSKNPDAEMRRIIERCLTGEARKKTQIDRIDIYKQREEIQHLREALENDEWSENLEDRVVELRRNLSILLLELRESSAHSFVHQEDVAISREQKDQVPEAVLSGENEAAYNEQALLLDEAEQLLKEVEIGKREETKRKQGRPTMGD